MRLVAVIGIIALLALLFSVVVVYYREARQPAQTIMMTAVVPGCGNGIIEGSEQCDGSELQGMTCAMAGFATGTIGCTDSCTYTTLQCTSARSWWKWEMLRWWR